MYNRTVKQQVVGTGSGQVYCTEIAKPILGTAPAKVSAHRHGLKRHDPEVLCAGDILPLSGPGRAKQ